jgi:hypothetical protein
VSIRFEDCSIEELDARAREDLRQWEALLHSDERLQRDVLGLPGFWPHAAMWVGTPRELASALGRKMLPPNSMVAFWDACADQDSPLEFQWFLDGHEATASVLWGNASHRRPKWDLSQE